MQMRKWVCGLLCLLLAALFLLPASAAAGPTVATTLPDAPEWENAIVQRGSRRTFDVWARNAAGDKITATVKLNDKKVEPTWDDKEKASYTLVFTQPGQNVVTVSASSDGGKKKTLTYYVDYRPAAEGEVIGAAVWSIEVLTIGCGYLIEPVELPIYEGETAADQLLRLLSLNGLVGYYGGAPAAGEGFYLAYIADGNAPAAKYNGYTRSAAPASPRTLGLNPAIPPLLIPHLEQTMTFFDIDDYEKNWAGYLGEFVFSNGSGWMYAVNNVFPNVGFADCFLADGDVVRVQFTLGYGADIGGFGAVGTDIPDVETQPGAGYFAVSDKDALTVALCRALRSGLTEKPNVRAALDGALEVMAALDASQRGTDAAAEALLYALAHPSDDPVSPPAESSAPSESSALYEPSAPSAPSEPSASPAQSADPSDAPSGAPEESVAPPEESGSGEVSLPAGEVSAAESRPSEESGARPDDVSTTDSAEDDMSTAESSVAESSAAETSGDDSAPSDTPEESAAPSESDAAESDAPSGETSASGGAIVSDGSEAASSVPKWLWAVVALGLLLAAAAAVLVVLRRRQRKNKGEDGHA